MKTEQAWQIIGQVVIDSEILVIRDPFSKEAEKEIDKLAGLLEAAQLSDFPPNKIRIKNLGILIKQKKGVFPIFAKIRKHKIIEIKIKF